MSILANGSGRQCLNRTSSPGTYFWCWSNPGNLLIGSFLHLFTCMISFDIIFTGSIPTAIYRTLTRCILRQTAVSQTSTGYQDFGQINSITSAPKAPLQEEGFQTKLRRLKLTWNLKMNPWKRRFLLKNPSFSGSMFVFAGYKWLQHYPPLSLPFTPPISISAEESIMYDKINYQTLRTTIIIRELWHASLDRDTQIITHPTWG